MRFPQKKQPRCGCPCGTRVENEDCADVREKVLLPGPAVLPVPTQHVMVLAGSAQSPSELLPSNQADDQDTWEYFSCFSTSLYSTSISPQASPDELSVCIWKLQLLRSSLGPFQTLSVCTQSVRIVCAALISTSAVAAEEHCPLLRSFLPLHPLPKEVTKVFLCICSAAQNPQRSRISYWTIALLGKVETGLFCVSLPRPVGESHYPPYSHTISASTLPSFNNASPRLHLRAW